MNLTPANNSNKPSPAPSHPLLQAGVGLIEVLIAVLVLSIGILGIAALQARALGNNSSSMSQSMATVASYSILEAMRADRNNALTGSYNQTVTGGSCPTTTDTLAHTQLTAWCTQLTTVLGNVATTSGIIACSATGTCSVTINFSDSHGTGIVTQTIVTQAGL